ncbi:MAG: KUP/HAK/KT family potassium transporter, partial [Chitinophagales bacterium]
AAYGLTITIDMIMTTLLMSKLLQVRRNKWITIGAFIIVFLSIELCFLASNLLKLSHGGWFTVLVASAIFMAAWLFYKGRLLRNKHTEFTEMKDFIPLLNELMNDESIPKEATNLVYLSMMNDKNHIDSNILYSVFRKKPKRADVYWFVHVDITNEPYGAEYEVDTLIPQKCFFVRLRFGFKVEHKVNYMFSKIVMDLVATGEVDIISRYPSLRKFQMPADFKFIVIQSRITSDDKLTPWEQFVVKGYRLIKKLGISTAEDFGLEQANMLEETIPIRIGKTSDIELRRI